LIKVTPTWWVDYEPGDAWEANGQSYSEQNVSFSPSQDPNEHGMNVQYSMGLNVGDPDNVSYQILSALKLTR
jgi:hypothetical protein